jgi:hypothetical protein
VRVVAAVVLASGPPSARRSAEPVGEIPLVSKLTAKAQTTIPVTLTSGSTAGGSIGW